MSAIVLAIGTSVDLYVERRVGVSNGSEEFTSLSYGETLGLKGGAIVYQRVESYDDQEAVDLRVGIHKPMVRPVYISGFWNDFFVCGVGFWVVVLLGGLILGTWKIWRLRRGMINERGG